MFAHVMYLYQINSCVLLLYRLLSCWGNATAILLPLAVQGQCMPSWWTAGEGGEEKRRLSLLTSFHNISPPHLQAP